MKEEPLMTAAGVWRVRPAGATHSGQAVGFDRLCEAVADELVGDLDEVQGPGETAWTPVGEHHATAAYTPSLRRVVVRDVGSADSDMTPMIDVTFQLVIFFMIAATYTIQKTLDLPATEPSDQPGSTVTMEELEQNNIMVRIAADGTVQVDNETVPTDSLVPRLRDAIRHNETAELVLDVDDQAVHDVLVSVLDAAGAAQIEKVLFVSRVGPADAATPP
jgi:biopolymer transport protein ExbD